MVNKSNEEKPTSENKVPFYKRGWFIGLAGLVIGAGIVGGDDDSGTQEPSVEESTEVVEAPTEEPEDVIEEEPEDAQEEIQEVVEEIEDVTLEELPAEENTSNALRMEQTEELLNSGPLADQGYFYYNEDIDAFCFVPTDPDLTVAFALINSGMLVEEYDFMRTSFMTLSETVYEASSSGLIIVNPENEDNILLWAVDGVIMYDFSNAE